MSQKNLVIKEIETYLSHYPHEADRVSKILKDFESGFDLWDRKNMRGHLTASTLIYNHHSEEFLMLHHKALNKWLAPGGHVDEGELPEQAALRECEEETGISKKPLSVELIDIDIHDIPARPVKNEGEHAHYDFRYLLTYNEKVDVALDYNESNRFDWVTLNQIKHEYPEVFKKLSDRKSPISQNYA